MIKEKREVCFLTFSVRGESFGRAAVYDALGIATSRAPKWAARRLADHLRKEIRGCSLVYAQRGTRPQYAIVRGVGDLAGLRSGHVEALAWIRYDRARKRYAPCDIRGSRPEILRALDAFNAECKAEILTRREAGATLAGAMHERFPMITPRIGGGVYVAALTKSNRADIAELNHALVFGSGALAVNVIRGASEATSRSAINLSVDAATLLFDSVMRMNLVKKESRRRYSTLLKYNRSRARDLRAVWNAVRESAKPWRSALAKQIEFTERIVTQLEKALV